MLRSGKYLLNVINVLIFCLLSFFASQAYAYSEIQEFICELGMNYYKQGNYDEALKEFRKALMADPNYAPARRYIQMVEQAKKQSVKTPAAYNAYSQPYSSDFAQQDQAADYYNRNRQVVIDRQLRAMGSLPSEEEGPLYSQLEKTAKQEISLPQTFTLDDISRMKQPIEIEQGKSVILRGVGIRRFLITNNNVIYAEKINPDEIAVTGKDIGFSFLHIWDQAGRWTIEFQGIFPRSQEPTYEEMQLIDTGQARNFKLRYTLGWNSFESGRRIDDVRRGGFAWGHGLSLTGATPYGYFDSMADIRSLRDDTDLTYLTFGLTNGRFMQFEDFSFRLADYALPFGNMALGSPILRGAVFTSPAFNNKFAYTLFWGREGGGRFGDLSPSLSENRSSYINGFHLNITPFPLQNYRFTLLQGFGKDRPDDLPTFAYDFMSSWILKPWRLLGEVAHDGHQTASLANAQFTGKRFSLNLSGRDIPVDFNSMTGRAWAAGELGVSVITSYRPTDKLIMSTSINAFRDRAFPALDNPERYNEDVDWDLSYYRNLNTTYSAGYSFQNYLGMVSQTRGQVLNLGVTRNFRLPRNLTTYMNYYHQESKSYSNHASDFINDRIGLGLRFSLIGDLYYFVNKEFNWLVARSSGIHSTPEALETGVDWAGQFWNSPLYGDFRFSYRDEEDTVRGLSFLSGEDYVEGYFELSCRPTSENEIYGSCRMRNVWAENPNVVKRIEFDFNAGMRYLWDTGVRFESVCNIEGYVFKDQNSDGLRQRNEPPVSGAKVFLTKDRWEQTNEFGFYRFERVKGTKASVKLDVSTIPSGYVLTVPDRQEITIVHGRNIRVDYGIISNAEIAGLIFEDIDGNGEYSLGDKGVSGVNVTLEDGSIAVTDSNGRYSFLNAPTGAHTLKLDLKTLPVYYIPAAAIQNSFTLNEGEAFLYNIPLRKETE